MGKLRIVHVVGPGVVLTTPGEPHVFNTAPFPHRHSRNEEIAEVVSVAEKRIVDYATTPEPTDVRQRNPIVATFRR